jgi:multisubunit Na+/H+ antiporter MnhG subunit
MGEDGEKPNIPLGGGKIAAIIAASAALITAVVGLLRLPDEKLVPMAKVGAYGALLLIFALPFFLLAKLAKSKEKPDIFTQGLGCIGLIGILWTLGYGIRVLFNFISR